MFKLNTDYIVNLGSMRKRTSIIDESIVCPYCRNEHSNDCDDLAEELLNHAEFYDNKFACGYCNKTFLVSRILLKDYEGFETHKG